MEQGSIDRRATAGQNPHPLRDRATTGTVRFPQPFARPFYRTMTPKRLSIIGVGLLGGSIGLAVKSAAMGCHVVGYGHRRSTLDKALASGAIDEAAANIAAAVKGRTSSCCARRWGFPA
jgi:hypothetical protein